MRSNHAGNKHPHHSKDAVMRLVVKDPVTQPHWKIGKSDVKCSLLATVPVPKVGIGERERKFDLGTCRFCFPDTSQIKAMAIETVNT